MKKIVVVDYGMGNLRSVAQALRAVAPEAEVLISGEISDLKKAERIVLPGQGAMPDCMKSLEESGLKEALMEAARSKPIFGVCVGEQMLFDWSEEGIPKDWPVAPARSFAFSLTASVRKTDRAIKFPRWAGIRSGKVSHILYGMVLPTRAFSTLYTAFTLFRNRPDIWPVKRNMARHSVALSPATIFSQRNFIRKKAPMSVCNCIKISYTGIPESIINPNLN